VVKEGEQPIHITYLRASYHLWTPFAAADTCDAWTKSKMLIMRVLVHSSSQTHQHPKDPAFLWQGGASTCIGTRPLTRILCRKNTPSCRINALTRLGPISRLR
jgi:hypothetical protein